MRSRVLPAAVLSLGALALAALPSPVAAQDWKGGGRIEGVVTDEAEKPIPGAAITADCPGRGGTKLKSDKKGRWVLGGVVACGWNLDVEAEGYKTRKITVSLPGESARLAPSKIVLEKDTSGPAAELRALAEKADTAYKAGRHEEARTEYEKLLAARPDLAPTIHQQIGFSYIQEKQYDKAVEHLEKVLAAEPQNAQVRAIAAQAALEGRQVEKGRQLLAGLDEAQLTSPDVYFNMGVNFFNAGEAKDAIDYFGKTVARDPAYVDAYYRRGLARLGLGQTAEAKADFQKVVELQPDGDMAAMAKKALDQLK